MEAVSLIDWDGPVVIRVFTVEDLRDTDGHRISCESVQWRWTVETSLLRSRGGRARGRTLATLQAEATARTMRMEHEAAAQAETGAPTR